MLKKALFLTFATLLCCSIAWGQYTTPETGKAYRMLTPGQNYKCMTANYKDNKIETMAKNNNAYDQMWILEKAGDNSVYIKNGLTGYYIQHATKSSELFRMADTPKEFFIKENKYNKGFYNILTTENGTRCLHSSPFNEVVVWSPSTSTAGSSEWVFEDAGVSIEVLAEQQDKFKKQQDIIKNTDKYKEEKCDCLRWCISRNDSG